MKAEAKREYDAQAYDGGCDTDAGFCAGAERVGGVGVREVGGGVPGVEEQRMEDAEDAEMWRTWRTKWCYR